MKGTGVKEQINSLSDGKPPPGVLLGYLISTTHLLCHLLPAFQFIDFLLPSHFNLTVIGSVSGNPPPTSIHQSLSENKCRNVPDFSGQWQLSSKTGESQSA